jgi:hypothetical protein
MTGPEALAEYDGWRYATATEGISLIKALFPTLELNNNTFVEGTQLADEFAKLVDLFGITMNERQMIGSYGMIYGVTIIGARTHPGSIRRPEEGHWVFTATDYSRYDGTTRVSIAGIAIVREVTEPTSLSILALGLLGFASRRFKK